MTPVNLVAMAVLATPRQALGEADLERQVELYQQLLRDAPYAPLVTVTARSGAADDPLRRVDGHARAPAASARATSCA